MANCHCEEREGKELQDHAEKSGRKRALSPFACYNAELLNSETSSGNFTSLSFFHGGRGDTSYGVFFQPPLSTGLHTVQLTMMEGPQRRQRLQFAQPRGNIRKGGGANSRGEEFNRFRLVDETFAPFESQILRCCELTSTIGESLSVPVNKAVRLTK